METWKEAIENQKKQMPIICALYAKKGLQIKCTCNACPEQYEVFKDEEIVAYMDLRHGLFQVEHPDCGVELLYSYEPNGDGCFDADERIFHLKAALKAIWDKIKPKRKQVWKSVRKKPNIAKEVLKILKKEGSIKSIDARFKTNKVSYACSYLNRYYGVPIKSQLCEPEKRTRVLSYELNYPK